MGITRTNNPLEYALVDGIVIDERAPSPNIQGVGTGVCLLIGQFQRGPHLITKVNSTKEFYQIFGKSSYLGNIQLMNKKFASLKVLRVEPTGSVKGTLTCDTKIKFTAKSKGVYGNKIKVTIEAGATTGKKYTVQDTNDEATDYFPNEVYDNVAIASITAETFAASNLVDVEVLSAAAEPANQAATALATGSDGSVVDGDYEDSLDLCTQDNVANILFLDDYNATKNALLETYAGDTNDKIVILSCAIADDKADAISDVANYRDTQGRLVYCFNPVKTLVGTVETETCPAAWLASIMSQTSPHIDPARAANTEFLYGATGLKYENLSSKDFQDFMAAGVCSFEKDEDIGIKIKSGVVTQIADSSKLTILRRRMADYLTNSVARFLKLYQNDVNSQAKRDACKSAIVTFDRLLERDGILPSDAEMTSGKAKLIDADSENDDESIAAGKFFIVYKRRIYSSMRFIVLKAEIGESVVVKEQ